MGQTPAEKRELRAARKAAGLCYFCAEAAIPGQVRCATHAAEAAATRAFRKANGLCAKCTSKSLPGKLHCASCMEAGRVAAAETRKERTAQGNCTQCADPAAPGNTRCARHAARAVAAAQASTSRLRSRSRDEVLADRDRFHPDGMKLCRYRSAHGGPISIDQFNWSSSRPDGLQEGCVSCRGLPYRRRALAYWRAQNIALQCTYCGGAFEHVDHFIPTSRGGTDDPSNLVPACTSCNTSKGDRMPAEWLALRGVA